MDFFILTNEYIKDVPILRLSKTLKCPFNPLLVQ